jgi:hypothetical protein
MIVNNKTPPPIPVAAERAEVKKEKIINTLSAGQAKSMKLF